MTIYGKAVLGLVVIAISGAALTLVGASVSVGGRGSGGNSGLFTAYSNAADYSWVAGRLERSQLEGGFWILVYQQEGEAPDQYGGRFVLGTDPRLDGFNAGELVVLFGRVGENQVSIFQSGTLYDFDRVERI